MKGFIFMLNIGLGFGVLFFLYTMNLLPGFFAIILLLLVNNKEIILTVSGFVYGYRQLQKFKSFMRKEELRKQKRESSRFIKNVYN